MAREARFCPFDTLTIETSYGIIQLDSLVEVCPVKEAFYLRGRGLASAMVARVSVRCRWDCSRRRNKKCRCRSNGRRTKSSKRANSLRCIALPLVPLMLTVKGCFGCLRKFKRHLVQPFP